jgi:multimeric flavodoxin WrbA
MKTQFSRIGPLGNKEGDIETELISLAGKNIKPCDGCRSCRTTKKCHINDGVGDIFEKMVVADGIILWHLWSSE